MIDRMHNASPDVLIIGAGPTGLILAHELLRRNISCRLIERRPSPSSSTRAFTLHARTMEMFDHMGISPYVENLREVCPGNRFFFHGLADNPETNVVLDFRRLKSTQYNYYGKVNQNDLDQVLRNTLAAKFSFYPEYGIEYVASEQSNGTVVTKLRQTADPQITEKVEARWLVGADGSNSAVRASLGLEFAQKSGSEMTMSMVDVKLDGFNGDRAWVNYYVATEGFLLVTGLPGQKYRLYMAGAIEKYFLEGTPEQAFQRALNHFNTGAVIEKMDWSSTWTIRKIVGDNYLRENIILCGDATHVHSPAGGQGMNACMQDAFNLGWKLGLVASNNAEPKILATYPAERRPIAEQVTEGADRMHQVLFNATIPIEERYQITCDPAWHDDSINRISALSHHYRDSCLGDDWVNSESAIHCGDRAPDCVLSNDAPFKRLYDVLRHPGFTLLAVVSDNSEMESVRQLFDHVAEQFGHKIKMVVVVTAPHAMFNYDETIIDPANKVADTYGVRPEGELLIIRPDLYFALRAGLGNISAVESYLGRWIKPNNPGL